MPSWYPLLLIQAILAGMSSRSFRAYKEFVLRVKLAGQPKAHGVPLHAAYPVSPNPKLAMTSSPYTPPGGYNPYAAPQYAQPSYSKPSYAQPSYAQPSYAQPSHGQPVLPSYGTEGQSPYGMHSPSQFSSVPPSAYNSQGHYNSPSPQYSKN